MAKRFEVSRMTVWEYTREGRPQQADRGGVPELVH
ncbi:hypothetical protein BN12_2060005 [Nostocoides japonicum T1-X7]|uniref:Uncharacterized protein n=1 Tax=Nostocoides japonicum T1-X7 TaxID=1194083 RepID=A0A077M072_9MICO|nr:hypothetical protein BN12_2060005 [Tetrasphaera japonica T1-X7]